jgi:hypothetical protein
VKGRRGTELLPERPAPGVNGCTGPPPVGDDVRPYDDGADTNGGGLITARERQTSTTQKPTITIVLSTKAFTTNTTNPNQHSRPTVLLPLSSKQQNQFRTVLSVGLMNYEEITSFSTNFSFTCLDISGILSTSQLAIIITKT